MEYLQLSFENISFYNFFEPWYSFLNWKIDRKIEQIFINIPIILTDEKMTFYRFNFLDKGNVTLSIEEKVSSKKITLSNRHVFLCLSFSCSEETGAEVPLLEGHDGIAILFIRNNETFWLGRTWINPFLVFHFCFLIKFLWGRYTVPVLTPQRGNFRS